jgi:hypothetical protein
MTMKFIYKKELYEPITETDINKIFSREPFYQDTYTVIFMKPIWKPKVKLIPCVLNTPSIYNCFAVDDFEKIIRQVMFEKIYRISPTFNVRFIGIKVKNGWWCCYFEKIHIWDDFASYGICTIFSPDSQALEEFQQRYEKIIETKYKIKSLKH